MAFLKPTKLKTDQSGILNFIDRYLKDSIDSKTLLIELEKEINSRKKLLRNNYKDGKFIPVKQPDKVEVSFSNYDIFNPKIVLWQIGKNLIRSLMKLSTILLMRIGITGKRIGKKRDRFIEKNLS
ncbi:MAG: hypothetical protein IID16_00985 [Candidatus Marinimicrobia bacterium]|nr:hypothetical protein [Candidatus Neomarinimicrobiota bacterium]